MKRLMGWKFACVMGLAIWMVAPVQAQPPTIVLSLKSVDELLDDADTVGEAIGQDGVKENAEGLIGAVTQGMGLAGVDRGQLLGAYWNMTSASPDDLGMPVVFVPVSEAEDFQKLIEALAPDFKDADGLWTMTISGMPLFAKISGDYCYISGSEAALKKLADPKKFANARYDVSIDVNIGSIPKDAKAKFLEVTEKQGRESLENGPKPDTDADARLQQLGFDWALTTIKALTNDGDKFTIGVDVNGDSRLTSIDLGLSGKSNTTLAKAMAVYGKTVPTFAAAVPDSAPFQFVVSLPTTGIIDKVDEIFDAMRESANAGIDKDEKLKDDGDRKAAKDVAKRLFAIAQATVKSGSLHSVIVVDQGDDDTVLVFGGTKVAKGDDAGKLFDDILKLSKESPDLAKVKADVARHGGARIHAITPDFEEKQTAMFGETPGHLAVRADSLWFSLGGGNLEALKKALDLSGKAVSKAGAPISLRIKPATLVTLFEDDDEALIERAKSFAGESGDVFNLEIAPTPNGAKLHLEFGLDLYKLTQDK
jgi:hypothetical protein